MSNTIIISSKRHRLLIITVLFSVLVGIVALLSFLSARNIKIQANNEKIIESINNKAKMFIDAQDNDRRVLLNDLEKNLRGQMRLNLEAAGRVIEDSTVGKTFNSREELIKFLNNKIRETTLYQRTYNLDGDWFSMLAVGPELIFNVDESVDCGQPMYDGVVMIDYNGRSRTRYDEVIWQDEAKYLLSLYGVINKPNYLPEKANFPEINKIYEMDSHLDNVEIYTNKDILYIKDKYPLIYNKMIALKIIMHYDTTQCEYVMNFITYNRSTVNGDNLFWYFNKPEPIIDLYTYDNTNPDKEILEVYVIPSGIYGFFNEPKMKGGGIFNKNYVKVSLVAGAQLLDYLKSYRTTLEKYDNNINIMNEEVTFMTNAIRETTKSAVIFNWVNMIIVAVIFSISVLLCLVFYTRIPYSLMDKESRDCTNGCMLKERK